MADVGAVLRRQSSAEAVRRDRGRHDYSPCRLRNVGPFGDCVGKVGKELALFIRDFDRLPLGGLGELCEPWRLLHQPRDLRCISTYAPPRTKLSLVASPIYHGVLSSPSDVPSRDHLGGDQAALTMSKMRWLARRAIVAVWSVSLRAISR